MSTISGMDTRDRCSVGDSFYDVSLIESESEFCLQSIQTSCSKFYTVIVSDFLSDYERFVTTKRGLWEGSMLLDYLMPPCNFHLIKCQM